MKVIKEGKLRIIKCPYCDSVLQYDINEDIEIKSIQFRKRESIVQMPYKYINCMVCNQEIEVDI